MTNKAHKMDENEQKLQHLAHKLSIHFWQKPCAIPVQWNGRLRRSMGRFMYSKQGKERIPLKIELSKHAAQHISREIFVAVLLHELCHYHLFLQGKPFADHHPVFEKELRRVGAISTNNVQIPYKAYHLYCKKCGKKLGTRQRFNPQRYRSTCCQANIRKEETTVGEFRYDGQILKHQKVRFTEDRS